MWIFCHVSIKYEILNVFLKVSHEKIWGLQSFKTKKKNKASQAYRSLSILFYVPATEHKDFDEKHETKCFPQKIDIIHLYMCVCVFCF